MKPEIPRSRGHGSSRVRPAMVALLLLAPVLTLVQASQANAAVPVKSYKNIVYRTVNGVSIKLDAYVPQDPAMKPPFPAVVMVHSGGWATLDKSDIAGLGTEFAASGFVAYVPNYRLSCDPADPPAEVSDPALCGYQYPSHEQDLMAAVAWVRQAALSKPALKTDPSKVAIWGTSAGGNLAGEVAVKGTGDSRPDALVSWSGAMDLTVDGQATGSSLYYRLIDYLGCDYTTCPDAYQDASPLYHVAVGDPPTLLVTANHDDRAPKQYHAIPMYEALIADGVDATLYIVPATCHGLACQVDDPWMKPYTLEWLHKHLGPPGPITTISRAPLTATTDTTATFEFGSASSYPPGTSAVDYRCSLDTGSFVACTSPFTYTLLATGEHEFYVRAFDTLGRTSNTARWKWTIVRIVADKVAVRDNYFAPSKSAQALGGVVQWAFRGINSHTATDATGMGLYDSGQLPSGATFQYPLPSAGTYQYTCTVHTSMEGVVQVTPITSPTVGTTSTVFVITWSYSAPPSGFLYDVQIQDPGSTTWTDWNYGTTLAYASFRPDTGGNVIYSFRARLRKIADGTSSGWATVSISVQ